MSSETSRKGIAESCEELASGKEFMQKPFEDEIRQKTLCVTDSVGWWEEMRSYIRSRTSTIGRCKWVDQQEKEGTQRPVLGRLIGTRVDGQHK